MDATFKPYLLRAVYDWCTDQGHEPYLAVAVDASCKVPSAYVKNNQIVLDISAESTKDLDLGIDSISFQARFGGVAHSLYIPMHRVIGLFPTHNQSLGAFFEPTDAAVELKNEKNSNFSASEAIPTGKSRITRVK
jgi:stringent starvation protein B